MVLGLASSLLLGLVGQGSPVLQQTFADDASGWIVAGAPGAGTKVGVTHDIAHVKVGIGSLQFNYGVAKGETNLLALPIADGQLGKMKSFKFWLQMDSPSAIGIVVQEKNGGSYMSRFAAPKGYWQKVEVDLSDFALNTGPDDPKDPDGKLDPDQIGSVMILDLSQFLIQGDPNFAALFGATTGARTMYLSDFQATTESLSKLGNHVIEDFARPQIQWLGVGGPMMSIGSTKSIEGSALKSSYHIEKGKMAAMVRAVNPGLLAGTHSVSFKLSAEKACKLLVQLEESSGGKYNTIVDMDGTPEVKMIEVQYKDLHPGDDSKDNNGKFDPELVTQFLIIDLSAAAEQADKDNTLWIGKIVGKP